MAICGPLVRYLFTFIFANEPYKREDLSILSTRNYRKFLKAIRTESPIQVLTNVVKRIFRTLLISYQQERISFNGSLLAILWILPNVPQKDKSSGERRLHHIFELLATYIDLYNFTEGERKAALPSSVVLIPEMSPDQLKAQQPFFNTLFPLGLPPTKT